MKENKIMIREMKIKYTVREAKPEEVDAEYLKKITSSDDTVKTFLDITDSGIELFSVVYLDSRNRIILKQIIEKGTVNQASPILREIFKIAIACDASSIICGHNHPSGNPEPSREDKEFTKELVKAGEILHIKVLDHIIISRDLGTDRTSYYSFADKGGM